MRSPALASILLLALAIGSSTGCAFGEFRPDDPFKRQFTLQDQHRNYTDFVRWSKFDEAATFVALDTRQAFLAQMPNFDDVRFSDWEALPWQFEDTEEKRKAVIEVTYRGYSMRTPYEVKVTERQTWERLGSGNDWMVRSEFIDLGQLAGQ